MQGNLQERRSPFLGLSSRESAGVDLVSSLESKKSWLGGWVAGIKTLHAHSDYYTEGEINGQKITFPPQPEVKTFVSRYIDWRKLRLQPTLKNFLLEEADQEMRVTTNVFETPLDDGFVSIQHYNLSLQTLHRLVEMSVGYFTYLEPDDLSQALYPEVADFTARFFKLDDKGNIIRTTEPAVPTENSLKGLQEYMKSFNAPSDPRDFPQEGRAPTQKDVSLVRNALKFALLLRERELNLTKSA